MRREEREEEGEKEEKEEKEDISITQICFGCMRRTSGTTYEGGWDEELNNLHG